jgi:hypothetical protein
LKCIQNGSTIAAASELPEHDDALGVPGAAGVADVPAPPASGVAGLDAAVIASGVITS